MVNIPNPLAAAARARPDHVALRYEDQSLTWRELKSKSQALAKYLNNAGLGPGVPVMLAGPNTASKVIAIQAIEWIGAQLCPLPPKTNPAANAFHASALLCAKEEDFHLQIEGRRPYAVSMDDLLDEPHLEAHARSLEEICWQILSSGSSGSPKVIEISASQRLFSIFGSTIRLGHQLDDRWLCALPLHHVAGLQILARVTQLATSLQLQRSFSAPAVAAALDSGSISQVSLVPVMLEQVLDARPQRPFPKTLRLVLIGGAATPSGLLERCRQLKIPAATSWGMTECASQIATRHPGDLRPAPDVGPPLAFAQVQENPQDALEVSGPVCPSDPFVTSDSGCIDLQGRVIVSGRRDGIWRSGGEFVDAVAIEYQLCQHPFISEALVLGQESPPWGTRPWAFVRGDRQALHDWDWKPWLGQVFPRHSQPEKIFWLAHLPLSALGKPSRGALLALLTKTDGAGASALIPLYDSSTNSMDA